MAPIKLIGATYYVKYDEVMPDEATPSTPPTRPAGPRPGAPDEGAPAVPGDGNPAPSEADATDLGIVDSLAQLSFLVQATLGKVAAEHGLSIIQVRLLGILRDREPGMQELAGYLRLDKSSMTGLVDRAERRGLVHRAPSPHDGRAVRVSLTDQGHATTRVLTADAGRRLHALTAHLTPAQRSQLSLLASLLVVGTTKP